MKPLDPLLQRLLNAAAQARQDTAEPLPFSVETRVLARWRRLETETEDDFMLLVRLFRRAMALAVLIMTLSGIWSYFQNKGDASTIALSSYAIKMQLPP
jgi:hypothetical protein